jgi:hypothetical protein
MGAAQIRKKRLAIAIILASLIVTAIGYYVTSVKLTTDREPPLIENLRWEPTRVVNDKVYDVSASFVAEDDKSPIASAELIFKPEDYSYFITKYGMRTEDYDLVFPDDTRAIQLTPVDGVFNSTHEEFVVPIRNITGGVEYKIIVKVKDLSGNEGIAEIKTPYIRQFENLGRLLYEDGIILGANYFPYYPRPHPWEALEPMAVHPLLGKYDVTDPMVISKHIDWATGHGINCLFMSWVPTWDGGSLQLLDNIGKFMQNPLSADIMISIQYEGIEDRLRRAGVERNAEGIYYIQNSDQWKMIIEDVKTLEKLFFAKGNFLKIDNKPVIYLYASTSLCGNVSGFVNDLKRDVNAYLICDYAHPWAATSAYTINGTGGWVEECDERGNCSLTNYAMNYDAWTTWAAGWYTPVIEPIEENYPKFLDDGYKVWNRLATKHNKTFVPSIIPGFINLKDPKFPKLQRRADMFKEMLSTALKYSSLCTEKKLIKIDTFNEFGEATGIEPTREEGFVFLKTIKKEIPAFPSFYVIGDLDDYAGDWHVYAEGNPTWSKMNVGSPSMDGSSLKLSITGGSPYSNVHFYRNFNHSNISCIKFELWFYFSNTTWNNVGDASKIQAIEFSCSIFARPYRYEWALQWENVGDGTANQGNPPTWRIWNGSVWFPLDIKADLEPETWHHLRLIRMIEDERVYYLGFIIDGAYFHLGITCNPTIATANKIAIAIQLDGNYKQDTYEVYLDMVTLEVGKKK